MELPGSVGDPKLFEAFDERAPLYPRWTPLPPFSLGLVTSGSNSMASLKNLKPTSKNCFISKSSSSLSCRGRQWEEEEEEEEGGGFRALHN